MCGGSGDVGMAGAPYNCGCCPGYGDVKLGPKFTEGPLPNPVAAGPRLPTVGCMGSCAGWPANWPIRSRDRWMLLPCLGRTFSIVKSSSS